MMLLASLKKIAQTLVVLFVVSVASFTLLKLAPGDPVELALGAEYSREAHAAMTKALGLDRPLVEQYVTWATHFLTGDWGTSYVAHVPIFEHVVKESLPVTLTLAATSLGLAILIGVPLGVLAATRRGGAWDAAAGVFVLTGTSFPSFYLGILLIWGLGVHFAVFPVMGFVAPWEDFGEAVRHMVLPALTLSAYFMAMIMRVTRANLIEVLEQPYVAAARARGEPMRRVVWVHAMRNVAMPLVTVIGLQLGALLQGTVLTETVFSLPGMGQMIARAVLNREYGIVQAGIMCTACLFVLTNLLVDLAYPFLDPRLRPR